MKTKEVTMFVVDPTVSQAKAAEALGEGKVLDTYSDGEHTYMDLVMTSPITLHIHGVDSISSSGVIVKVSLNKGSMKWPVFMKEEEFNLRKDIRNYLSTLSLTPKQHQSVLKLIQDWADFKVDEVETKHAEDAAGINL
jgi:hypothetical protein